MAGELEAEKWAVISGRGCEAVNLSYEEARRLVRRLAAEGQHGLSIVTDQAASRLSGPAIPADAPSSSLV